jgi:hypothetical protein
MLSSVVFQTYLKYKTRVETVVAVKRASLLSLMHDVEGRKFGAATFSIITLSKVTLSIMTLSTSGFQHNDTQHKRLSKFQQNDTQDKLFSF